MAQEVLEALVLSSVEEAVDVLEEEGMREGVAEDAHVLSQGVGARVVEALVSPLDQ